MQSMSTAELQLVRGGAEESDTCKKVALISTISCTAASFGLIAALIAGPTCVGTAIGYAVNC